jgi:hypothetical protein
LLINFWFLCISAGVLPGFFTQAVDVKLVADRQDNRKGHHGEDNNIYLNDANAVTASSVLWSLSTSFKKSLSSALSVLTICWMAEAIMPDFLNVFTGIMC